MPAVILIGHGGVARDMPRSLVRELKSLEAQRRTSGESMGSRERELDRRIRDWPRTPESDPYKAGLERVADALRPKLEGPLVLAYNEFCAPSIADAIDALAVDGVEHIELLTTMITPGGNHSENEIPKIVEQARKRHPAIVLDYVWPYDLDIVARFFVDILEAARDKP